MAGNALPRLVMLDPGIGEAFAMHVRFALFDALDAEDADHDGRVTVNLDIDLLVDGLGWFVFRIFYAGEKFAFRRNAAVNLYRDKRVGEKHVQGLGILGLDRVIPSVLQ